MNRRLARLDRIHLRLRHVDPDDVVALARDAASGGAAHVAEAEDNHSQRLFPSIPEQFERGSAPFAAKQQRVRNASQPASRRSGRAGSPASGQMPRVS